MWSNSDLLQTASFIISGLLVLWGCLDVVLDEIAFRRKRAPAPSARKRFGGFLVSVLGFAGILVTWRNGAISDAEQHSLKKRLARLVASEAEHRQLAAQVSAAESANVELNQAANAVAQARVGIRDGIETLDRLHRQSNSQQVQRRSQELIASVASDYEAVFLREVQGIKGTPRQRAEYYATYAEIPPPITIAKLVKTIRESPNLAAVTAAFMAFRLLTSQQIRIFDFKSIESWCHENQSQCRGAA